MIWKIVFWNLYLFLKNLYKFICSQLEWSTLKIFIDLKVNSFRYIICKQNVMQKDHDHDQRMRMMLFVELVNKLVTWVHNLNLNRLTDVLRKTPIYSPMSNSS
jgi:hypothetical protein